MRFLGQTYGLVAGGKLMRISELMHESENRYTLAPPSSPTKLYISEFTIYDPLILLLMYLTHCSQVKGNVVPCTKGNSTLYLYPAKGGATNLQESPLGIYPVSICTYSQDRSDHPSIDILYRPIRVPQLLYVGKNFKPSTYVEDEGNPVPIYYYPDSLCIGELYLIVEDSPDNTPYTLHIEGIAYYLCKCIHLLDGSILIPISADSIALSL
jgi:hypothetical protein